MKKMYWHILGATYVTGQVIAANIESATEEADQ